MNDVITLDKNYSTSRRVIKAAPQDVADQLTQINKPEDKFETVLFLPQGNGRKGEGGLRTKGYFKKSYKEKPLISIVTVVYNGEQYLEETIQSVIHQTYDNVEYIVIDGGSSDGTLDIIKKYENFIDYWVSEKDEGIYDAMNKGLKICTGVIIGILNSDDWYQENSIQLIVDNKIKGVIYGLMKTHFNDGTYYIHNPPIPKNKECMKISSVHPTVFVHRDCYKSFGFFNTNYTLSADFDLLLKFYTNGVKFMKINKIISNFRGGGASSDGAGMLESYIISKKYNFKFRYILTRKIKLFFLPVKNMIRFYFPSFVKIKREILFYIKKQFS